jgi:transcriptional regulator with XRE-family HTH domain
MSSGEDLEGAGIGNGHHAFKFVPPQGVPLAGIEVRRLLGRRFDPVNSCEARTAVGRLVTRTRKPSALGPYGRRRIPPPEPTTTTRASQNLLQSLQLEGLMKKSGNPIDKHVGARVRTRRMMLKMSQTTLGEALGVTFQQVQKYEKGTNRIGAGRLQEIAGILQVPIQYFFEGAPVSLHQGGRRKEGMPDYVSEFLTTTDGIAFTKAFMQIKQPKLRRLLVHLAQELAYSE